MIGNLIQFGIDEKSFREAITTYHVEKVWNTGELQRGSEPL